ncbi:hypothetical protein EMCRGX_G016548 [Ephydatia muelleri]
MESDIVDDLSDDLIRDVFTYLSTNKYPEASSSSRKRVIRKKALKFFFSTSGELMYKQKLKGKEPTFLRYVQSPEERRLILLACHVHPTSGHMGRTRTLHRIKERVMWHGMVKDCTEMIRTCDICQRMNRKLTCGVPELHPIPVKSPWYMIGIDFIGPISPPGEDGSQYILTISDYFTKWVEAIPTPDKTATTVANCLFKIFMRMGLPRVMLSDNGSEFCNKLNDKLAEILGVKRRLTTPYHPQANGLDERYNQTLQNMLAKFVSTKQTVWSSYLDTCTFAYNTSRHESSTYTPFQLMFGRQAILPVDIDLQKESGDELHHKYQMLNDPDIVAVQHKHQVILEDAKKHILDAQKKQKQKYDSKCAKPNCFQVGELVMKKNFRRKKMKGGKLQDRFDGPHRVVKKMPHGVYELISKDGTLIRATGGHLKMYHSNMLQGSISFDDKQASSKVISDDPSTSGVKPDDTSICSDIECYDPSTPSDAKHDGLPTPSNIGCDDTLTPSDAEHDRLPTPSNIGCDDTLTPSDAEHDRLPTPSNIGCDDTLTPSDAEHDRLPTPSNIGCDDTLTTSDVEHDGLTTPSNTGCDDTLTTSDVERDGLTTPSDVGCDDDTHTISHAKPDDQPTTSDTEPKDLLTLKDAEPPVLLFCSCKTRCATKRCLCKLNHSFCGHYCHPGKSCCNMETAKPQEVVNLSASEDDAQNDSVWIKVGESVLHKEDKVVLSNNGWLTDNIIHAAQQLLKQSHPHISGLQNPILQKTKTFDVQRNLDFVQCLNIKDNHWITVSAASSIPDTINVYDSLNGTLTEPLKQIIADLMHSAGKQITVQYVSVQYQKGSQDCGLFAIAFACEICFGKDPSSVTFVQSTMRQHLIEGLEQGNILPFPSAVRRQRSQMVRQEVFRIFCSCRMPNDGRKMIQCSKCREWYHLNCVRVSRKFLRHTVPWFCGCK